jgi:cell division transport system ATP-binding protein
MTFSSQQPVVSVKDVSIVQTDKVVLSDVNFDIGKGEFVYLIGRTGSGKSSLLKTLYADLDLHAGSAQVAGIELKNIKRNQVPLLRRKMGIIFQDFQLFADRTVAENLLFVMKATGWTDKTKMKKRVSEVLMKVGLGAVDNKMPHQLSGGEQQRVVIARALINEPMLIIADEPTGNLDPEVSEEIMKIFVSISHSGTSILMATHNHTFIVSHPGRVLKCEQGRVLDSSKETFAFSNIQ